MRISVFLYQYQYRYLLSVSVIGESKIYRYPSPKNIGIGYIGKIEIIGIGFFKIGICIGLQISAKPILVYLYLKLTTYKLKHITYKILIESYALSIYIKCNVCLSTCLSAIRQQSEQNQTHCRCKTFGPVGPRNSSNL